MAIGVGGGGFVGFAHEVTNGTYVAPTKFTPVLSETLDFNPGSTFRRPIRQTVDQVGMVAGNVSITGSLSIEALHDVVPYFLYCMRMGVVKTGVGPFTYTITPTSVAVQPTRTMSITVSRNGVIFGYVGCVVSKMTLSIQNDILQMDVDILGLNEATQTAPGSVTWPTSTPIGPGMWNVQIPTATQVFDMDTFSLDIDESGAAQYRLKNTGPNQGRGAQFIAMGERTIQMTASRDFLDKTDYSAFQANTAQDITIVGTNGASSISLQLPSAYKSQYSVPLGTQGDIVRGSLTYDTTIEGTGGNAVKIIIITPESIT